MALPQVFEGTPDQLVMQLSKLSKTRKYKVTITAGEADEKQPKMITFGMFPQLQMLTDDDFKNAEWREKDIDL